MQKIEVILLKDFKTLGKKYDTVQVKPVYARNILFPQGIARFADKGALNDLRSKMEAHRKSQQSLVEKLKAMIKAIEDKGGIEFVAEANEAQKLYGHIHAKEIAAKLTSEFWVEVSADYIHSKEIDTIGTYTVNFEGEGIQGNFQVNVLSKM